MAKTPVKITDCSTWYTKEKAAEILNVSTKTIENFAKAGKIQQVLWRRPTGGPRVTMYDPSEVNQLALERRSAVGYVSTPPAGGNGHELMAMGGEPHATNGAALIEAVLRTIQKTSEHSEKLFLTIPEAAHFTGLSEAYIRRRCQAGTVGAIRDAGWKIRRSALEAL